MKTILLMSFAAALALAACATGAPAYTAEPFSAQVVDAQSGQPIEGAVVVANWELVRGGLDGPTARWQLEVKETVTDADGRFAFPGFTRLNPSFGELRASDPRVIVFKGGYEPGVYHGSYDFRTYFNTTRRASVDGKVLKLADLTPTKTGQRMELLEFYGNLSQYVLLLVQECDWPRAVRLFRAMDAEKRRLKELHPSAFIHIGVEDFTGWSKADCRLTRASLGTGQK